MSKLRILMLPCHEILEYDEVKLFHELGYEVFSPGSFVCNENRGDNHMRPSIPGLVYDPDILEQWHRLASMHPGEDTKDYLTKEFVDNFSTVICMHIPRWISNNWEAIKHKRVIWRTIGQSIENTERQLAPYRAQGMEIVRYSPTEPSIPGFIGQDALIRFYKDPDEYGPWNGKNERVVTFCQSMKQRGPACNFDLFELVTRPFSRHLYGPGNEGLDWSTGKVSYEQLKEEMRCNRVYFYTGTHPASYTLNFIEAWLSGMPIVAIGPKYGNASYFPGHNLYEIPQLIKNGENGFISDNINELRCYISALLTDEKLAQKVSQNARKEAIRHFSRSMISLAWKDYLENGPKR